MTCELKFVGNILFLSTGMFWSTQNIQTVKDLWYETACRNVLTMLKHIFKNPTTG